MNMLLRLLLCTSLVAKAFSSAEMNTSQWYGRSVYFVMTDRFASLDDRHQCSGREWCGGTLRGVISKLDYIRGMGFDAVWITPVVTQDTIRKSR